jgi:hypothetical protein
MRRAPLLLALTVTLALGPVGPAAAAGRCAATDSETARSTPKVRVYWKGDRLYGCVRESGVRRQLYASHDLPNELSHVGPIRVAGYHVAFAAWHFCTVCGEPGPSATVDEIELRHDRRRRLGRVRRHGSGSGARVDALVLDHCGRIAYRAVLADSYRDDEDPDPRLFTWVPGGNRRLIDRGAIERHSIALDPGSVYWVRDGRTREAPLEPLC